jgi:hypothetical protein
MKPIYSDSVKHWKRYEHHMQPLLEVLGDLSYYKDWGESELSEPVEINLTTASKDEL